MKTLLYFIIFFTLIFGPKIGPIDTSIIVPVFLYPCAGRINFKLPKVYYNLLLMLILLTGYQGIIQIVNDNFDFEAIGRLVRASISAIIVGLMFGSSAESDNKLFFKILLYVIIFHALLIIIAANFYPINQFFSIISGNDRIKEFRASGLLAGFDIAGYISIIGMAMILFNIYPIASLFSNFCFMFLLLLSCYFTSRVSTVMGVLIFFVFAIQFLRNTNVNIFYRLFFGLLMSFVLYKVTYMIILILDVTLSLGLFEVGQSVETDILSRHSAEDVDNLLWASMFIFPKSDWGLLFGTGADILESDIGYIKGIYRYGIIGLGFSLIIYLYLIVKSINTRSLLSSSVQGKWLVMFIFVSTLVLTFKNNYIFVRGVFPAFLIIISTITCNNFKKN